jgi:hypothetical protein
MIELPKLCLDLREGRIDLGIIREFAGEIEDVGPVAGELADLCPNALVLVRDSQAHTVFL